MVNLDRAILRMRDTAMTQEILDKTMIADKIGQFLGDETHQDRRTMFIPMAIVEDLTRLHRKWLSKDFGVKAERGLKQDSKAHSVRTQNGLMVTVTITSGTDI